MPPNHFLILHGMALQVPCRRRSTLANERAATSSAPIRQFLPLGGEGVGESNLWAIRKTFLGWHGASY